MTSEAFIQFLDERIGKHKFYLAEWTRKVESTPAHAFRDSLDAFRDAAYLDVYQRVRRMMTDRAASLNRLSSVRDFALSMVISCALQPCVRENAAMNIVGQYTASAWSQLADLLSVEQDA